MDVYSVDFELNDRFRGSGESVLVSLPIPRTVLVKEGKGFS